MDTATILLASLLVAALVALAMWLHARIDAQAARMRQEMQEVMHQQARTVTEQVGRLTSLVTQQLGQVTSELSRGVTASAELAAKAKDTFAGELRRSQEALDRIHQQLGVVQQAGAQLSTATQALHAVLGGAKTRGLLGEVGLERLLEDALPQAAYETQYRFTTGVAVDAIVRAGDKLVPIDSKFPLESFRRLTEGGEDARKEFARAVRTHADSIAEKYILPDEGTLDFALMFVPSESVYYELLMSEDAKGARLDDYCRSRRVIPASPNSLHAYLGAILIGLRGLQVQQNARRLLENLGGLNKQFETFAEVFDKLGTHLRNAQASYGDATGKLDRARATLEQMAQGALPDPATQSSFVLEEPVSTRRD
jgi:DNA recombination protein RmuC